LISTSKKNFSLTSGNLRDTLDLVLRSLRVDDLSSLCQGQPMAMAELAALRDAFVDAGVARMRELCLSRCWLQVSVQFDPLGLQWCLFATGALQDRVRCWIEHGALEQFSFVHKPPGARLRFLGEQARLLPALSEALDELVRCGDFSAWSHGLYDPEPYLFGGETGLAIAHRFFTAESLAVLAFHRLRLRGEASLGMIRFSLLLIDLLLREIVADKWERWDVWCKMKLAGRALSDRETAQALECSRPARQELAEFLDDPVRTRQRLSDRERRIVDEYCAALPAVAAEIGRALEHAALLWPLREILPFWIVFHWNRMTFDLDVQRQMAFLMTAVSSPHAR
jgi:thiopeptide-type bacteriocin biosynthesis protein